MEAVRVRDVWWTPSHTTVLAGANLRIPAGEIRGLLVVPGSGRTAILRVLLGLVKPDRGSADILGQDCWADAVALHRSVSSRPNLAMWPGLTGSETLAFLHRLAGDSNPQRCRVLLERFGVDSDTPIGSLDARGRKLLSLAATFCRPGRVFLVDDAVADLAAPDRRVLADVLSHTPATVLLTGAEGDGTAELCDDVSIIEAGHCGSPPAETRRQLNTSA